jgi:hypothetical protein
MIARNVVIAKVDSSLSNLAQVFELLGRFQVTRFSVCVNASDAAPNQVARNQYADYCEKMAAFSQGKLRTFGWLTDFTGPMALKTEPKVLECWNWTGRSLEILKHSFPTWLSTGIEQQFCWSFFRRTNVLLDITSDGTATFIDLLPAEIVELQMLGLSCNVIDRCPKDNRTPEAIAKEHARKRDASYYFGPHEQINATLQKIRPPVWWTKTHDSMILKQVKKDQWRWKANFNLFTKGLSEGELAQHKKQWEEECRAGRGYGIWYNGIGAYIRKRAIELGAHRLVTSSPQTHTCIVCENEFDETSAREKYLGTEKIDVCTPCLDGALWDKREDLNEAETLLYLQELAEILGYAPPSDFGSSSKAVKEAMTIASRARLLGTLKGRPSLRLVNNQFGTWFNALKEAGVLENDAIRKEMGTTCLSSDGHVCLSLAEKRIDDLLAELGIQHEREVYYAGHRFRADFLVGDTVIEYFGLMNRHDYKAKAEEKERFCQQNGIPFLALFPEDFSDDKLLREKLQSVPLEFHTRAKEINQ